MKKLVAIILSLASILCIAISPSVIAETPEPSPVSSSPMYTIGDTVFFGSYEQDNVRENGLEPIEWIVIAEDDDSITLLSRNILGMKIMNNTWKQSSWETCDLRAWMNGEFINIAFSPVEQDQLLVTTINPCSNPEFPNTLQGNATEDRVWFLSADEWLALPKEYQNATPTWYAKCHDGALGNVQWLRTNGNREAYFMVVRNGEIWCHGFYCIGSRKTAPVTGIRPVIRISKTATTVIVEH